MSDFEDDKENALNSCDPPNRSDESTTRTAVQTVIKEPKFGGR